MDAIRARESIEQLKTILDDFEEDKRRGHNRDFTELTDKQSKRNYERLCTKIEKIEVPAPFTFSFNRVRLKEIKNFLKVILVKVLGDKHGALIENLVNMIKVNLDSSIFVGDLESDLENGIYIPKKIYISKELASVEVVAGANVIMQALLDFFITKYFNLVIGNIHYKEELNILMEYIVAYEWSRLMNEDIVEKHAAARLFYLKQQLSEDKKRTIEIVVENVLGKRYSSIYHDCQNHEAYAYFLAEFYGEFLKNRYLDDPKKLKEMLDKIICGEFSIPEMNAYYGLSLRNEEALAIYNQKLNKDYRHLLRK